jgi:class 3 adenylate cyclase
MLKENPYCHRGPIKEARHFHNRVRETSRALQMIKNGQSVSVIGPRRIGKTSFLFYLSNSTLRGGNGLASEQSTFVYIDGEMLGGFSRSDILRVMIEEIAAQTDRQKVDISRVVDYRSFEQTVRELIKPGQQLVYLMDEFESLSKNPNLEADFFHFLRSLITRYNIVYVTASKSPLLTLIQGGRLSSPFFNIFVPIQLGLFSEDDARKLIRRPSQAKGVEFSRNTEDYILDLVGPHPFFLQVACFYAFELSQDDSAFDKNTHGQLERDVQADLEGHFKYFVDGLTEDERRVLVRLPDYGPGETSTAVVKELERQCLIRHNDGRYVLVSQAFAHFVRQHLGATWAAAVAEGDRRMTTVLFVDIVGFTPMTEQHKPEDILTIMKPALRMFVNVVDRHGGKVADFGGDSVMALFGIPTEQPDDAIRAVRAGLEIQANVALYARELKQSKGIDFSARVGLDTGVVVLGEIGGEQRAQHTALGDAVNLAKRIETAAGPGTVLISDHTYRQIRGQFKTKSLGSLKVKGKSRLVKTYQVLEERTSKN